MITEIEIISVFLFFFRYFSFAWCSCGDNTGELRTGAPDHETELSKLAVLWIGSLAVEDFTVWLYFMRHKWHQSRKPKRENTTANATLAAALPSLNTSAVFETPVPCSVVPYTPEGTPMSRSRSCLGPAHLSQWAALASLKGNAVWQGLSGMIRLHAERRFRGRQDITNIDVSSGGWSNTHILSWVVPRSCPPAVHLRSLRGKPGMALIWGADLTFLSGQLCFV